MRLSSDERKQSKRRSKKRFPASLFAAFRRGPRIALIVAAGFSIAPSKARAQNQELDVSISAPPENEWKEYTKEELVFELPKNPTITLNDRIVKEVHSLLNRVNRNQSTSASIKARASVQSSDVTDEQYFDHLAHYKDAPKRKYSNTGAIGKFIAGEFEKASSDQVKSKLGFLDTIQAGVKFDFNIANLFASSADTSAPRKNSLRYGLVLKDITPVSAPDRVAANDSIDELNFANSADVEWTIGPLTERQTRKLFKARKVAPYTAAPERTFWDNFKIPSLTFAGDAKPDAIGSISDIDSTTVLPNVSWQLRQTEGLYTLDYRTQADGSKIDAFHTFYVPLVGSTKIGRRFTDNWDVVSTSAYDILVDKRAPVVSLHYLHFEHRYKGDLKHSFDPSQSVTLSAMSRSHGINRNSTAAAHKEQYSLGYNLTF